MSVLLKKGSLFSVVNEIILLKNTDIHLSFQAAIDFLSANHVLLSGSL